MGCGCFDWGRKTRGQLARPLLFVAALAAASAAGAASPQPPVQQPARQPQRPPQNLIVINGLSGHVWSWPAVRVFKPQEDVTIRISPADLINFTYSISVADEVLLVPFYVVGATTPPDVQAAHPVAIPTGDPHDRVLEIEKELHAIENDLAAISRTLALAELTVAEHLTDCGPLPGEPVPRPCRWPHGLSLEWLSSTWERLLDHERKALGFEDELARVAEWFPDWQARPDPKSLKERAAKLCIRIIEALKSMQPRLLFARLHPTPEIEQTLHLKSDSRRYSIRVSRTPRPSMPFPLSEAREAPATEAPTAQEIAVVTLEAHARARFNVGLGFGAAVRPQSRQFGIVESVTADNKIKRSVKQTSSATYSSMPIGTLGIYFGSEVDAIDRSRRPRLMIVMGAELAAPPSAFLLGLGLDWAQGVQLLAGVTHYQGVHLADGWKLDQEIPAADDGNALVAAVPTVTRGRPGFYVGIGFRPAIFKTLWENVNK